MLVIADIINCLWHKFWTVDRYIILAIVLEKIWVSKKNAKAWVEQEIWTNHAFSEWLQDKQACDQT